MDTVKLAAARREAEEALAMCPHTPRGFVLIHEDNLRALLAALPAEGEAPAPKPAPTDYITREEIRAIVGEGFHTMLRKGIDGHGSGELWKYIDGLGDEAWCGMLDYWVVDGVMAELDRSRLPQPAPALPPEVEAAAELATGVRAAMGRANGRWCEWGGRAEMVKEALDEALANYSAACPAPPSDLLPAAREALAVLTEVAEAAQYWSSYDVPIDLGSRVDFAKARLAGALGAARGGGR